MKKNKQLYLIHCKDGVLYQNEKGNTLFSWSFDSMRKFANNNDADASNIFKTIFSMLYRDTSELDYEVVFKYETEKTMHELM